MPRCDTAEGGGRAKRSISNQNCGEHQHEASPDSREQQQSVAGTLLAPTSPSVTKPSQFHHRAMALTANMGQDAVLASSHVFSVAIWSGEHLPQRFF